LVLGAALVVAGCNSRVKKIEETFEKLADEFNPQPVEVVEEPVEVVVEEPEPEPKDRSFDDFLYTYGSDEAFRLRRTKFPLPYYRYDEPLKIDEGEWGVHAIFDGEEIYTLILDGEDELELDADTTQNSIQFEWITLENLEVEKFYFERMEGVWMLEAVNVRGMDENDNGDFVQFYKQFVADSLYQQEHVHDPLTYITVDPDNEFDILESFIGAEQWPAFKPELPVKRLSNIYYGQRNNDSSVQKILKLIGVADGYSSLLYFRKVRGEWQLYKFEDTSV